MNLPIDVTNVRLETQRLILRPWTQSDLKDFYEYASVDGVGQMAGWPPHGNIQQSQEILNLFIQDKKTLALELKDTGKVIGSVGIEDQDEQLGLPENLQGRELGYAMSKKYWGRGLMPEAVKVVIDYCFQTLGYDYLTCGHYVWNTQSQRVIEKCGFKFLKETIHHNSLGNDEKTYLYLLTNPCKER